MPNQFMLVSALNGDVFDIKGNSTAAGAVVQAFRSKASGINLNDPGVQTLASNQTWEVNPDPTGSPYHIIQNPQTGHCIDIEGASLAAGAALDAFPVKQNDNENQLWSFLPDPNGSASYFIQNPQTGYVIEIQNGSANSGTRLVVNPRRLFDNTYQLWAVSDGSEVPAATLAPTAGTLQGDGNYVWLPTSQTDVLGDFTVEMVILEDLVTTGFSVQINGTAPYPAPKNVIYDAEWSQFGMVVQNNSLVLFQQVWHKVGAGPGGKNDPLETQETTSGAFLQIENNTIAAGTRIELKLVRNASDNNITGITGQAFNKAGAELGALVSWTAVGAPNFKGTTAPESALSPLAAIQVVIVGVPGGNAHFTSGMGVLTISTSTPLSAQTYSPNLNGAIWTAENSNCYYGQVPTGYSSLISQPFGLPNPRVTAMEGVWSFTGAGLLPNSKLTVSGEWEDEFGSKLGNVLPNILATTQNDGSFGVGVQVDNPDAPYASGRLSVTFTDEGGNIATGVVLTPLTVNSKVFSSGSLGPP